jgi:zinc protease
VLVAILALALVSPPRALRAAPAAASPGAAPARSETPYAAGDPFAGARIITLDNGLTVALRPLAADPVVAVQMYYRAGARNETIGITGIAHFLEHMLFRGSEGFGLADVTGVIERAGGEWHGYTWLDGTTYFEAAPRDLLPTLLRLEAERMTRARMAPGEVEPERGAVFQEYRGYQLDPRSDLFDAVMAILFQQHPYRNNTMGWESDLAGITHADLQAFYRRYYGPRNAVLAIAGDLDPVAAEQEVRAVFGAIPAGGDDTSIRTVEPPLDGTRRVTLVRAGASPALVVSFLAPPPARSREYAALMILDTILARARGLSFYHHSGDQTSGGGIDPSARLAPLTRSGPADDIGTAFVPTAYPGHYSIYATVRPGRSLTEVESAIIDTLAQAAQTISDEEVARARRLIAAADSVEIDAPIEIAHELAFWTALGGARARGAVSEAVRTVSADEVRALAAGLTPAHAAIGMLLPPAFTPERAASEGDGSEGRAPDGRQAGAARGATSKRGPAGSTPAASASTRHGAPERARRRQIATRRLTAGGGAGGLAGATAIVDTRPGLGTFALRVALAPMTSGPPSNAVVARLSAAATALAADEAAQTAAAGGGFTLVAFAPGEGRFDERDTLQLEMAGPSSAWDAAMASLEGALGRALAAAPADAGLETPSLPESLALSRLDAAVRAAPTLSSAAGSGGAGTSPGKSGGAGIRLAAALVSPYAGGAVTSRLDSLAGVVGTAARRWPAGVAATGRGQPAARAAAGAVLAPPFAPGRQVASLPRVPQGRLLLAIAGDRDATAQEAVAWLLHHNYSGRLGVRAIAETGLVYGMDSESARRGPPLVMFSMGADPLELARLESDLRQVLDGAAGGFTAAEVAAYRTYAAGRATVRLAHPDQAARLWTSVLLRGGDDATPAKEAERAAALTPEAVAAAAGRMLAADRRLVVVVGREPGPAAAAGSD